MAQFLVVRQQDHTYENTRNTNVGGDQDCHPISGRFGSQLRPDFFAQRVADWSYRRGRIHDFILPASSLFSQPERFFEASVLSDCIRMALCRHSGFAFMLWRELSYGEFAA